jgi:adenosylcobinamide-phosphate synthase
MLDPAISLLTARLFVVIAAILVQASLGGPRRMYHAIGIDRFGRIMPRFVRAMERKLNRSHRSDEARKTRGIGLVAVTVAVSLALVIGFSWMAGQLHVGFAFELMGMTILLPLRPAADRAAEGMRALKAGQIDRARKALAGTPWRNAALMDSHGVTRALVELLAVTFSEKLVSPAFWYVLLGLPGAVLSRTAGMLDDMVGSSPSFGKAAIRCHHWLHFLPSRLGGLMLAAASTFAPYGPFAQGFRLIGRTENRWQNKPGMWALTAMAGGLNLALGGPSSVMAEEGAWIGTGTAQAQPRDIGRALQIYAMGCFFLVGLCAILR